MRIAQLYFAEYADSTERENALKRFHLRNWSSLTSHSEKGDFYQLTKQAQVILIESGKKNLSVVLEAPSELIPSLLQEIQSPAYLGKKFS